MNNPGELIFFCGKMGAGKSTNSLEVHSRLAAEKPAVLLSEDEWLAGLYPDEINNFDDYKVYSARLKPLLKEHIRQLLAGGTTVVMDFPANTPGQRKWFKEIYQEPGFPHRLIYLEMSDEQCLAQLAKRRILQPQRAKFDTEEVFHQVTQFFQEPTDEENFNIERI